jgi:hypothetical protein
MSVTAAPMDSLKKFRKKPVTIITNSADYLVSDKKRDLAYIGRNLAPN